MYSPEFVKKFKNNRPLTDKERDGKIRLDHCLHDYDPVQPNYELAVIRFNSTFVEITDRNYPARGIGTTLTSLFISMFFYFYLTSYIKWLTKGNNPNLAYFEFGIFDHLYYLVFILIPLWFFFREAFTYTHFPIRLNRKNRTIYVWRRDGTVLTVPWDKVFFQLRSYPDMGGRAYDLLGHVLAPDGVTIQETFSFSSHSSSVDIDLKRHFEFFRRYMEDGPREGYQALRVCLPIANRRETWWEGFMRLLLNMNGHPIGQILLSPLWFLDSLGRWIAMRTSKIPQWPDWVEKECTIDPNDPYIRESGFVAPRN